jgi:hypothetical protein
MLPKVDLLKIRKLGEVVDDSVLFFKQNYRALLKAYFYICGVFWLAGIVSAMFNQTQISQLQARGESIFSITFILTMVLVFVNYILTALTVLSYISLYQQDSSKPPTVEEVWSYVKYYILRILGSSVLLLIINALGFLLCIFPGIYLIPVNLLIITVMVIENGGIRYSYDKARQLLKKNWWQLLSSLLVITFINVAALIVVCIPVAIIVMLLFFFAHVNHDDVDSLAISFTLSFAQIFYILPVIVVAISYYSFNEQMDDNSLLQRIDMIGTTTPTADNNDLPAEEY